MKYSLGIAILSAFTCPRASATDMERGAFEELLTITGADAAAPSAAPRSGPVLNEAWLRSLDPELQRSVRLLARTPTGLDIITFAGAQRLPIVFGEELGTVIGSTVIISREMLRNNPYVLLHEMEHARQIISFGLRGGGVECESGAMSIQGRAWVEAGGPRQSTPNAGADEINDGQMQAWLKYPRTYYWIMRLRTIGTRAGNPLESSAGRYWDMIAREESSWRGRNGNLIAALPFSDETILKYLNIALLNTPATVRLYRMGTTGGFSPGLARTLEELLSLPSIYPVATAEIGRTESPLPGPPTARDLELLSHLDFEFVIYKTMRGEWRIRKGGENGTTSHDLAGRIEVEIHNHPPEGIRQYPVNRLPSPHDLLNREAPAQYVITTMGIVNYDRPPVLKHPVTRLPWKPAGDEFFQTLLPYLRTYHDRPLESLAPLYRDIGFTVEFQPWEQMDLDFLSTHNFPSRRDPQQGSNTVQ